MNHKLTHVGEDTPHLRDLMLHFIPKYAAEWKNFGSMLGLEMHDLECIAKDNAHESHWSRACMQSVFACWLQKYPSPTWGKVDDAIDSLESLTSPEHCYDKGILVYNYIMIV